MSGRCSLCGDRKGKRSCPGKGGALICSVCCGTKRQIEVDCPEDCAYLTGAHAPAWEGRESERRLDLARVAPHIESLTRDEAALFFYLLAGIVKVSSRHRDADDARWGEAIAALSKTLETQESGLVYEHHPDDWHADVLVRAMRDVLAPPEAKGEPIAPPGPLRAVMAAVGRAFAATALEKAGPRAFLETAARLTGRIAAEPTPKDTEARRILEP